MLHSRLIIDFDVLTRMKQLAIIEDVEDYTPIDPTHEAERILFQQKLEGVIWADVFFMLVDDEGWYWRDAAYIAWKSVPRDIREPKLLMDFSRYIGMGKSGMSGRLAKNPLIEQRVTAGLLQNKILPRLDEVIDASIEVATTAGYKGFNDRKMLLQMGGLSKDSLNVNHGLQPTDDLSNLSNAELMRLAGGGSDE